MLYLTVQRQSLALFELSTGLADQLLRREHLLLLDDGLMPVP